MAVSKKLEPGAPPPAGSVPLCVPHLVGNEWGYIKECLDTNWVSSVGPYVERFERDIATRVGVKRAIAMASGTAALHLALLAVGVKPDDEVLVSSLTFIAPANAIRYVGAWPVFIDADPEYGQMDPKVVVEFLTKGCEKRSGGLFDKATGRRIAAIMPVHILGHPVDMDPIVEIAKAHRIPIIEDATESLGSKYKDRPCGRLGDIACFSFNGNKLITTGGGGMAVTDRDDLAERCRHLSTQAKDDPLEYVHSEIGYNYRLTNVLAAMGCAQLEQLDAFIAKKRQIADRYERAFGQVPGLTTMKAAPWASSVFWLYTMQVDAKRFGMDSRALLRHLESKSIQTRPLWQPMHQSKAFAGAPAASCPNAERWNRDALSLPCSVGLSEADQERVIGAVLAARS
jgi:perosamine synthetase